MTKPRAASLMALASFAALSGLGPEVRPPRERALVWRDIPIVNPGFEETSRPLAEGEQTNGSGGAGVPVATYSFRTNSAVSWDNPVIVTGWRTLLSTNPNAKAYAGAMRPWMVNPATPYLTGFGGSQVGVTRLTWIQQTLDHTLRPATRYRLTYKVGYGMNAPSSGVYAALIAVPDRVGVYYRNLPGTTLLAGNSGPQLAPPPMGTMAERTLEFTTPRTLPPHLQEHYIAISLIGSDGFPAMCYDDFRLQAAELPRETQPSASAGTER